NARARKARERQRALEEGAGKSKWVDGADNRQHVAAERLEIEVRHFEGEEPASSEPSVAAGKERANVRDVLQRVRAINDVEDPLGDLVDRRPDVDLQPPHAVLPPPLGRLDAGGAETRGFRLVQEIAPRRSNLEKAAARAEPLEREQLSGAVLVGRGEAVA